MNNLKRLGVLALCATILAACGNSRDAATIYVVASQKNASSFPENLAAIARRHGLSVNLGQSFDEPGREYFVVEASGNWLGLWGMNMPLSGSKDPSQCGHYVDGHPDPGQFVVTVDHGFGKLGINYILAVAATGTPHLLATEIGKELTASGYEVKSKPELCSPLSKMRAPRE